MSHTVCQNGPVYSAHNVLFTWNTSKKLLSSYTRRHRRNNDEQIKRGRRSLLATRNARIGNFFTSLGEMIYSWSEFLAISAGNDRLA